MKPGNQFAFRQSTLLNRLMASVQLDPGRKEWLFLLKQDNNSESYFGYDHISDFCSNTKEWAELYSRYMYDVDGRLQKLNIDYDVKGSWKKQVFQPTHFYRHFKVRHSELSADKILYFAKLILECFVANVRSQRSLDALRVVFQRTFADRLWDHIKRSDQGVFDFPGTDLSEVVVRPEYDDEA